MDISDKPNMAKAEKVDRAYIGRALNLTLLAPEMVEAILDGREPEGVTLPAMGREVAVRWGG
jgi:hypothetical protein